MSEFKLIKSLNESLTKEKVHTEILTENIKAISKSFEVEESVIVESASKVLYQTEVDARKGLEIDKDRLNKALALLVLVDDDIRDAFNINKKKIDIINKNVDTNKKVDDFLYRLVSHPSIASIIKKLGDTIEGNKEAFVNKLAKARLFFDRV